MSVSNQFISVSKDTTNELEICHIFVFNSKSQIPELIQVVSICLNIISTSFIFLMLAGKGIIILVMSLKL